MLSARLLDTFFDGFGPNVSNLIIQPPTAKSPRRCSMYVDSKAKECSLTAACNFSTSFSFFLLSASRSESLCCCCLTNSLLNSVSNLDLSWAALCLFLSSIYNNSVELGLYAHIEWTGEIKVEACYF